ncbi:MAG: hypothetical protein ACLP62_13125 [Acidimicrobiales bacterium]
MADNGAAIMWGDPKTGREKKALDLFGSVIALNDKAVAEGRLASWDVVLFEPSAVPPDGVMRVYGTSEQVNAFLQSDEFEEALQKATLMLNNVGVRRFVTGGALMEVMGKYTGLLDSL